MANNFKICVVKKIADLHIELKGDSTGLLLIFSSPNLTLLSEKTHFNSSWLYHDQ